MKFAALFLAAAVAAVPAFAQRTPHRLTAQTQEVELTKDVAFLVDPSASLAASDVAALADRGQMTAVDQLRIPMLRVDHGEAFWIRLQARADPGAPRDWLLEAGKPNVDRMQVFVQAADGRWSGFPEAGAARPFSTRPIDHRAFVYPVRIEPGATATFLVRVVYAGPSAPRVRLWQPAALAAADRSFLVFAGLFFGLVLGMILYNVLLYVAVNDRGYLLYVGCVICTAGGFAGSSGLGAQFVWGDLGAWASHLMYTFYAGSLGFSAALTREFLQTRLRLPALDKALLLQAWASVAVAAIAFVMPSNVAVMLITPLGLVGSVLVPGSAAVGFVRRWPGTRFFLVAWIALYAGGLVMAARTFGLIPINVLVENSFPIGSAFEMMLLSLALADRINDQKRQKDQAQSLALGILEASQALSVETRLDRLHQRVYHVIAEFTGASAVRLLLRDADLNAWVCCEDGDRVLVGESPGRVPVAPADLAQVERTHEMMDGQDGVLLLPLTHQGELRALLLLQRRPGQGPFTAAALATLQGIAGPLAVSLENALLYERLEQHVAERTEELRRTQQELVATARRAGMAEISTNVLHNVGNTLNSVNVSAQLIQARLAQTRIGNLALAMDLLDSGRGNLAAFFEKDEKGRLLPGYLRELAEALLGEREALQKHLDDLLASVDHIKNVVATQQAYAGPSILTETVVPGQLVEDALRITGKSAAAGGLELVKEIGDVPPVRLDKTRALQILVNLVDNARNAVARTDAGAGKLIVGVDAAESRLRFRVQDTGCGIAPGDLTKIFSHGFSTTAGGHGFGLHSCALAANEMGGTLTAASEGPGKGATFTLDLPLVAS